MKAFWRAMTVTITVVILIVGIFAGLWLFNRAGEDENFELKDVMPDTTTTTVVDKPHPSLKSQIVMGGASTAISKATGTDINVSEYVEKMDPSDQAVVYEITENIGVKDVANAASDYAKNGTISQSTLNSMTQNLTEEEKAKLLELGLKYGTDFLQR